MAEQTTVKEEKKVNKGKFVGRVPLPRGEIYVYKNGLEFKTDVALNTEKEEWQPVNTFFPVKNWLMFYEVGMRLLNEDYKNPVILEQYFDISEDLAKVLSEYWDIQNAEKVKQQLEEMIGVEETPKLINAYDRIRRYKEVSGSKAVEFYNAKRDDFVAYLLVTDSENKQRSRFAMNDINLTVFLKFVRQNLSGIVTIADPKTGQSLYVMKELGKERNIYRVGNSLGETFTLNVVDRISLEACLSKYFKTGKVRQIRVDKFRLMNSEKEGKPVLGVGKIIVPLAKEIYKVYGLISNCMYL